MKKGEVKIFFPKLDIFCEVLGQYKVCTEGRLSFFEHAMVTNPIGAYPE